MIDLRSYAVVKLKAEKYFGLNGIPTRDLCDTGAVLYQLSYQANWHRSWPLNEFVIYSSKVKNISEYIKVHMFELREMAWRCD